MKVSTVRKKRAHPEAELQKDIMAYLRAVAPANSIVTYFPLGGGGLWHGINAKALGAVPGFPDIALLHDKRIYCMEVKTPSGTLSDAQRSFHGRLQDARIPVAVVRSIDDARRFLLVDCGLRLREHLG